MTRASLELVCQKKGLSEEPCYFACRHRPLTLFLCLIFGTTVAAGCTFALYKAVETASLAGMIVLTPFVVLSVTWSMLLVVELIRGTAARIKPFTLVTPKVLLQSDYEHGTIAGYRLSEAESFQSVNEYDKEAFKGRRYQFKFPDGAAQIVVDDPQGIRQLEQVLELARTPNVACQGGVDLLPDPQMATSGNGRSFTNPFGEFWMLVAALLCLALLGCFVLSSMKVI